MWEGVESVVRTNFLGRSIRRCEGLPLNGNCGSVETRNSFGCPLVVVVLLLFSAITELLAQPDPSQMSGIPRPDPNLPNGVVTVRVIRGSFANNVIGHPVELRAGDRVVTADTDAEGRATFTVGSPGERALVATDLDGRLIESEAFPMPGRGGVAVMLVGNRLEATDPVEPLAVRSGRVSLGPDSRILIELGEENVEVYYLLEVLNIADHQVAPQPIFEFLLPAGAQSGTVLQGSSPRTLIEGSEVSVSGEFSPGVTPVQVAYVLPYSGGSFVLSQTFPADFDQLLVFAEKWGSMDIASGLFDRRGEMGADETGASPLMWGAGREISAGSPILLELNGLPYHSSWPRIVTLTVSGFIIAFSVWGSLGVQVKRDEELERREVLKCRREKLFTDLVRVEHQRRQGKIQTTRYGTRRAALIEQLQRVLRELEGGLAPVGGAASVHRSGTEAPA